jgi:hypothetical protein
VKRKKSQDLKSWRRNYIAIQTSKGRTQREIAILLNVGLGTVNRDLHWLLEKAREENANFIRRIQEVHEKSMTGLNAVIGEGWSIIESATDNREKLDALELVKDCYSLQEELSCNLPIIDEALKFDGEGQVDEESQAARYRKLSQAAGADIDGEVKKREGVLKGEQEVDQEAERNYAGGKEIKDCIQGSEEKVREDKKKETTNKTF